MRIRWHYSHCIGMLSISLVSYDIWRRIARCIRPDVVSDDRRIAAGQPADLANSQLNSRTRTSRTLSVYHTSFSACIRLRFFLAVAKNCQKGKRLKSASLRQSHQGEAVRAHNRGDHLLITTPSMTVINTAHNNDNHHFAVAISNLPRLHWWVPTSRHHLDWVRISLGFNLHRAL